ncbi:MAG: aminotransferase class V-fold PLP-dependent enzyme [Saprospiraceae bacterium]|nr:aminotransferase class V-fold PLP-dependent enzyme [Saprospiraceae bacterium]
MLLDRIKALEQESKSLHGNGKTRQEWTHQMTEFGLRFLNELEESKTYFSPDAAIKNPDGWTISEEGYPMDRLLTIYENEILHRGINAASGGHFGYIPGGGLYPGAIGDYLAATGNTYSGIAYASPGGAQMEEALIHWMCQLAGWDHEAGGTLTSGGSLATLTAFIVARDRFIQECSQIRHACIYLTSQVHHCIHKAIHLAGLHFAQIRRVRMREDFTMDTDDLRKTIEEDVKAGLVPMILVGSAGTTDTGIIDPLETMADMAREFQMWYHIDAAYGGFFALVPELIHLFKGWEKADSIVIDPHKGLFLPYGIGAVLIRDRKLLFQSMRYSAAYMQDADLETVNYSPADFSPELTRHFRTVRMWLPLKLFGVQPIRAAIEEKYLLAQYAYRQLEQAGWYMGPKPVLSVFLFRVGNSKGSNEVNRLIIQDIHADGHQFISSTSLDGIFWLRIAVLSFRSHLKQVEQLLALITHARNRHDAPGS